MDIIGVIPARSGSTGVKNKNIKKIRGKNLLRISIEKLKILKKKKFIKDFIVSTDSKVYLSLANKYGAKVLIRPKQLASNKTRIVEVLNYLKKKVKNKYFLTLVPTAPLISVTTLKKLILKFKKEKLLSLGTISKINTVHPFLAMKKKINNSLKYLVKGNFKRYPRQIRPELYYFNGCVFIRNTKLINSKNYHNNCLGKYYSGHEIPLDESCNIDTIEDLNFCKKKFNEKKVFK